MPHEGAGCGKDPAVYASAVVQQESNRDLKLLDLFEGGWGGEVRPSGGLGGPGAEDGGGVDGRGIAGGHTERTKTSEKERGVAGVSDGEGAGRAVVRDREAKKFRGDGMGFGVVEG